MKNITILGSFFILAVNISCSGSRCKTADPFFVSTFQSHLNVLINFQEGRLRITSEDYAETLSYLGRVTGITPRADYSSTLGFRNKKEYKEDIRKLNHWLSMNRCSYTTARADSALRRY